MTPIPEHTMALCATCRRAVYAWYDHPLFPVKTRVDPVTGMVIHAFEVGLPWWAHYVLPADGHEANPILSERRSLMCATCRQPQVLDSHGWHCANEGCSSADGVDKA